jgi:hypothetical protein
MTDVSPFSCARNMPGRESSRQQHVLLGLRGRLPSVYHHSRMHRSDWLPRTFWTLAAIVWLAAGPLMLPVVGALRCHHLHGMPVEQMAQMQRPLPHPQAPCYCDQMTAGLDGGLLLTPAVPTVFPVVPFSTVRQVRVSVSRFPSPVSRVSPPSPPPPIEIA